MRQIVKKILITLCNPLIKRLGYVTPSLSNSTGKNNLLTNFYSTLKHINFIPGHIVDVGANHGTWTRETLHHFPAAYYTMLEPQPWMRDSMKDILDSNPKVKFNAVGAGEKPGTFKFTIVDRDDSCSFIYTEAEAKEKGFRQIEVPVVTLNNLLAEANLPVPEIIKIDAEGLDIEVLKGASDFFGKTEIFMVEAGVVNRSIKNNFLKVITFMDENGYRLFEITDLNRPFKSNALWLVELVFIKKNGYIDSQSFV